MAFTYNPSLPSSRDKVRFLLQDTANTATRPALLDDGEIDWAVSTEANVYMAAAMCADILGTRFRGLTSKSVGSLSLSYASGAETWKAIANRLRARGSTHQNISAGGVFKDDRDAIWDDDSLLRPSFFSRLHEDSESLPPSRASDSEENLP